MVILYFGICISVFVFAVISSTRPSADMSEFLLDEIDNEIEKTENAPEKEADEVQEPEKPQDNTGCSEKVNAFRKKYYMIDHDLPEFSIKKADILYDETKEFISVQVMQAIKTLQDKSEEYRQDIEAIDEEIKVILSCPGCTDESSKLKYLHDNEQLLDEKKNEIAKLSKKANSLNIQLISRNTNIFNNMKKELIGLLRSKRRIPLTTNKKNNFIFFNLDMGCSFISCDVKPVNVEFSGYECYVFPDVIIVFNYNDEFITALEPSAMQINIYPEKKTIYMRRQGYENWKFNDDMIADDSCLVSQGNSNISWLHTKKDGTRDMRYKDNPFYETRTDTYEYTKLHFKLGELHDGFSLSIGGVAKSASEAAEKYTSIEHENDAVSSLIGLLKMVSDKKGRADILYSEYERSCRNIICRLETGEKR